MAMWEGGRDYSSLWEFSLGSQREIVQDATSLHLQKLYMLVGEISTLPDEWVTIASQVVHHDAAKPGRYEPTTHIAVKLVSERGKKFPILLHLAQNFTGWLLDFESLAGI